MILITILLLLLGGTHRKENPLQTYTSQCPSGIRQAGPWGKPHLLCFLIRLTAQEDLFSQVPAPQHLPPTGYKKPNLCSERCLHCPNAFPQGTQIWSLVTHHLHREAYLTPPSNLDPCSHLLYSLVPYPASMVFTAVTTTWHYSSTFYYPSPILEPNFPREEPMALSPCSVHCA